MVVGRGGGGVRVLVAAELADLNEVSVHGIIYDIYYVIMIMNTDYAQIMT